MSNFEVVAKVTRLKLNLPWVTALQFDVLLALSGVSASGLQREEVRVCAPRIVLTRC